VTAVSICSAATHPHRVRQWHHEPPPRRRRHDINETGAAVARTLDGS